MRFKLDENLGAAAARALSAAGHDVDDVHAERLCGFPDPEVLRVATADDPVCPDEFGEESPAWGVAAPSA